MEGSPINEIQKEFQMEGSPVKELEEVLKLQRIPCDYIIHPLVQHDHNDQGSYAFARTRFADAIAWCCFGIF